MRYLWLDALRLSKGWIEKGYYYSNTVLYIILIVLLNTLFSWVPLVTLLGASLSPMDSVVGIVYVLRDFAQREIGHKVIFAMFLGSFVSYFLADRAIAVASVSAFLVAEFVDWGVYTFTRRPLSERVILSASLSTPLDSLVFLGVVHQLNWLSLTVLTFAKMMGVWAVCYFWHLCKPCIAMGGLDRRT